MVSVCLNITVTFTGVLSSKLNYKGALFKTDLARDTVCALYGRMVSRVCFVWADALERALCVGSCSWASHGRAILLVKSRQQRRRMCDKLTSFDWLLQ